MSSILWKNFHLCFSKFKCLPPPLPYPPPPSPSHPPPHNTDTGLSPTSILIKNFNSLYDHTSSDSKSFTEDTFFSSSSDADSDAVAGAATAPPDLASVYASRRFFFSSPGRSNAIVDSTPNTPPPEADRQPRLAGAGGVTVQKYSSDPYADFRRSMQEMIEAREPRDAREDWEYLHELLLCYLALNPKHTHKFIVGAFTDIVIVMMSKRRPASSACHRTTKRKGRQNRTVSRQLIEQC